MASFHPINNQAINSVRTTNRRKKLARLVGSLSNSVLFWSFVLKKQSKNCKIIIIIINQFIHNLFISLPPNNSITDEDVHIPNSKYSYRKLRLFYWEYSVLMTRLTQSLLL